MSDNNRGNIVSFKATGWVEREVADKFAKRIGDSVSSVVRSALLEYLIKQRKNNDEVR